MLPFTLNAACDETLYSLVARHGILIGRLDAETSAALVFGRTAKVLSTDHHCGLDHAARVLGFPNGAELLHAHTAHPYTTSFATAQHRGAAEAWALRGEGRHCGSVGLMSAMLRPKPCLAFCERCVLEDGGPGVIHKWRRAHQLPGVLVCHLHGLPLRSTTVTRSDRRGKFAYAALTDEVVRATSPAQPFSDGDGRILRRYARASARLLRSGKWVDPGEVRARLRRVLAEFRWERAGSLFASSRLVRELVRHPRVEPVIRAMGADWPETTWTTAVNGLLHRGDRGLHPLFVLMALEIADATLDDLLIPRVAAVATEAAAARPDRPPDLQLCANVACAEVRPDAAEVLAATPVVVRASCPRCGFTIRSVPGPGRRPTVLRTAASWDAAVAKALADPGMSVRAASCEFGASPNAIMRAARRAGAWRPEWRDRPKLQDRTAARRVKLIETHRAAWSEHMAGNHAGVPTKALPRVAANSYRWLHANDRAWLRANGGPTRTRCGARIEGAVAGPYPKVQDRETIASAKTAPPQQ